MDLVPQEYDKGINHQHSSSLIGYDNGNVKYIYFIGIGGAGMSAIAKILINSGYVVSGSDMVYSPVIFELGELGVNVNIKQDGESLGPDTNLVIASAAINENNPDLVKARALGIKVVKYSEFLGSLMKKKCGIAVSGTHGKTTTTAMISTILKKTGYEPSFVIGGDVEEIGGNSNVGNGSYFIAEACEYDRTFLNLSPQIGIITNIEEDHLDYYIDIDGITDAFAAFVSLIPEDGLLIVNNDDENIKKVVKGAKCKVESYSITTIPGIVDTETPDRDKLGLRSFSDTRQMTDVYYKMVSTESDAKWLAVVYYSDKEVNCFRVFRDVGFFGDFCLKTPGLHNVSNALAAIAVCNYIGLNVDNMKKTLASFNGVNRRFQTISSKNEITIIDDFAHHPTEIKMTLETARLIYPSQRIWCVFQPHQHNRTKFLLKEFAMALTLADKVIIADIYAARDSAFEMASVSSLDLKLELELIGGDVECIKEISEIVNALYLNVRKHDVVMVLGAGDIWKVAYDLKNNIENKYD